jgi:hypothetical protein
MPEEDRFIIYDRAIYRGEVPIIFSRMGQKIDVLDLYIVHFFYWLLHQTSNGSKEV